MRGTLAAVACLAIVLGGCKAKEVIDKAEISKELDKHGTTDLMKQVADDQYTAPADNKLTDAQVQMYLKVREREKAIAQVAKKEVEQHGEAAKKAGEKSLAGMMEGFKGLGSVADMLTADIRAAKDLGYNTQEYLWVKEQVLAASGAAMTEKMAEAMNASLDQAYEQAKKAQAEAKDEATKKMYAELVANYEKSKAESAQQQASADPAIAHNREILKKYESELNAVAAELAKYADEKKPEEAKKQ